MEDFDIFTDEIKFTKPFYRNVLHKLVHEAPSTPSGPNYESGRKLLAEESLADNNDAECAFNFSEAIAASVRTMAVYREEQIKSSANKLHKIAKYLKPINDLKKLHPVAKADQKIFDLLSPKPDNITEILNKFQIEEDLPFHRKYLRFSSENNVDNLQRILKELPKEWTVIQLTAPYNPNENLQLLSQYRRQISSIYLTMFTNDYLDDCGPFTINIPANVTKEGEKPLFMEIYSILDENYKTIDNAKYLNNKRLIFNYWHCRDEIDLRMMSVINVMDKHWLGGWTSLLTGRLIDSFWKPKIVQFVDNAISDWGLIRLTQKQRVLLYNLIENSLSLSSQDIRKCIRLILTEQGNPSDMRQVLTPCGECSKEFKFLNELCIKCLSKCFQAVHNFSLVDGIKAFLQLAYKVKDGDEWAGLKKANRLPVILIVDEMLDIFPWESLPALKQHPVSRIENIHFLYYLYKTHETSVVDGYFETSCKTGRYIINPEKNLPNMQLRMHSFVQYWCKGWAGRLADPPPPEDIVDYLRHADIYLYCGHGDGINFANGGGNGAGVEGAVGAKVVCILSGCSSVRLLHGAGRAPPSASHARLHIAGSPLVIGSLWEVTDLEVDKVVSTLVSLFVPSDAPVPWPAVGKTDWSLGEIDTSLHLKCPFRPERDLLRAVCRARDATNFIMISSSLVARGLPARVRDSPD